MGIIGALVGVAWYSSSRFTAIETSIKWIKESITKLEGKNENAFEGTSPIKLLEKGESILEGSGLKKYIDENQAVLIRMCCDTAAHSTPYEIQEAAFTFFDTFQFGEFDTKLKQAAFEYGSSLAVVRRIGGIYFRDIMLQKYHYKPEDLDR